VTNTGGPPAGSVGTMSDEQWMAGVDSTLMNVVRLTRLVESDLRKSDQGRLVHITSLVAKQPNDLLPISSTLRAGLMGLTRIQANAFAPDGVTVNSVLPGHTLTDRQVHLAEIRAEKESISVAESLDLQAASVPMGRLADPSEIAAAIVFLCSRQAGYVTGQNLVVDGGVVKCLS
jgi:3-oxoacyl-[acyl-carrier protein] reductase